MKHGRGYPNPRPKPKTLAEIFAELNNASIEGGEMFPILMHQNELEDENISKLDFPKTLPIEFVNQFEKQILKNHYNQSIERLAERGGLHPTEFCAAMYGMDIYDYFGTKPITNSQTVFSLVMIIMKLNDFKKK